MNYTFLSAVQQLLGYLSASWKQMKKFVLHFLPDAHSIWFSYHWFIFGWPNYSENIRLVDRQSAARMMNQHRRIRACFKEKQLLYAHNVGLTNWCLTTDYWSEILAVRQTYRLCLRLADRNQTQDISWSVPRGVYIITVSSRNMLGFTHVNLSFSQRIANIRGWCFQNNQTIRECISGMKIRSNGYQVKKYKTSFFVRSHGARR